MEYTEYDTRLAAYVVLVEDRPGGPRILLALWNEGSVPSWTLPGGGVEIEESLPEAAVREVLEETGYDAEVDEVAWVSTRVVPAAQRFVRTHRPMRAVRVIYRGRVTGGRLRDEVDGSTDTARWIPLDEVADLPHVSLVDEALTHLGARSCTQHQRP